MLSVVPVPSCKLRIWHGPVCAFGPVTFSLRCPIKVTPMRRSGHRRRVFHCVGRASSLHRFGGAASQFLGWLGGRRMGQRVAPSKNLSGSRAENPYQDGPWVPDSTGEDRPKAPSPDSLLKPPLGRAKDALMESQMMSLRRICQKAGPKATSKTALVAAEIVLLRLRSFTAFPSTLLLGSVLELAQLPDERCHASDSKPASRAESPKTACRHPVWIGSARLTAGGHAKG